MKSSTQGSHSFSPSKSFEGFISSRLFRNFTLSVVFAALTALLSLVKIPLPWTPVPVTGQTVAVLLSGLVLGCRWGGFSQLLYITLGISGLNWFASGSFAPFSFFSPTSGYLVGFILAAIATGFLKEKLQSKPGFIKSFGFLTLINLFLIYIPGLAVLALWTNLVSAKSIALIPLLTMGLFPFIAGDVLKVLLVTSLWWKSDLAKYNNQ